MFLVGGLLAIVGSGVFALLAVPHFEIPAAYLRAAQIVVLIAGANVAISLLSGIFGGILVGLQRFDFHNSIALSSTGIRAVAILLALRSGKGLITLALVQLGATVGEFILGFLFTRKLYPEMRFSIGHMYRDHVALIFSFGVFALLLQASTYLVYYTDAMVIGAFLPVSMITFFAIAGNLTIYARDLVGGFSRIMTPMASHMEVKTGTAGIRDASLKAARYCAMAILPIFITFIVRGHSFISLWMGPSYADLSCHVLWILSIPWVLRRRRCGSLLHHPRHRETQARRSGCHRGRSLQLNSQHHFGEEDGNRGRRLGHCHSQHDRGYRLLAVVFEADSGHSHSRIRSLDLVLSCGFPAPVRRLHIRRRQALASSESNDFLPAGSRGTPVSSGRRLVFRPGTGRARSLLTQSNRPGVPRLPPHLADPQSVWAIPRNLRPVGASA